MKDDLETYGFEYAQFVIVPEDFGEWTIKDDNFASYELPSGIFGKIRLGM